MTETPVLIVGGSLAGLTLANLLAANGIGCMVIDRAPPPEEPVCAFRPRVSAINRASENILQHIGCWQRVKNSNRAYLFDKVHVEHEEGEGAVDFNANDHGLRYLGHMVENECVTHALYEVADGQPNIDVRYNTKIDALTREDGCYRVQIGDNSIGANVIVGADGARSWLRQQLGVPITHTNYQQRCIVGYLTFEGDLNQTAWQRFLSTGPLGLLPMGPHHASLALSATNERASELMALDEDTFCAELTAATNGAIGYVQSIDNRASFPLHAINSEHYSVDDQCVLIGDAAHAIHPLAGLGANLGLMDAATLAEEMVRARDKWDNTQLNRGLKAYQRRRKPINTLFLHTMSGFNRFFGNQKPHLLPTGPLREGLLRAGNAFTPAKGILMRTACGLSGDIPQFAQNPARTNENPQPV